MSKHAQPKMSDLREFYSQAVTYAPDARVAALRNVIKWYDTKAAFDPMPAADARFNKLRELALNNPGEQEALTAAERIIPRYEAHFLKSAKNPPSLAAVQAEIKTREKELKAKWEAKQAEEKRVIESTADMVAALSKCLSSHGLRVQVARQQKAREYNDGVISLGLRHAQDLSNMALQRAALSLVDYACKALSYDASVGKISSAKYVATMPALIASVDTLYDSLGAAQPVAGSAGFRWLKRQKSDKAKLVGERYRPYTYQAIIWQRLYEAKGGWVLKADLTAGLDTPWPHRIPIHLQKEGERGSRWVIEIEKTRVRMHSVQVATNFPDDQETT